MSADSPKNQSFQLQRVLGSGFAFSACIGGIIGLGILRTPGEIATVVTDPSLYVALWAIGGLVALMSTSVAAELVSMAPSSGGYYGLVKRAYGSYAGFLIGWVDWLTFAASLALKVVVLVEYLALLIPVLNEWKTGAALVILSLFGTLQMFGVRLGAGIQQAAAAGMGMVIIGFALALWLGGPATGVDAVPAAPSSGLSPYALVAAAIIFTYDGWLGATYFSGEIKGGGGMVARACVKSVAIIVGLYLLINGALAYSVPLGALAGEELALSSALALVFGPKAETFVIVAAILILLAHQNLNFMQGPRILQALSVDGLGIKGANQVAQRGNPVVAVLLTWMLSIILILSGGFNFLLNLSVLFFVFLYVALLLGVIILRRREPETHRPFRAIGHPFTTIAGILFWGCMGLFMASQAPDSSVSAAFMVLVSVPVYFALVRFRRLSTVDGNSPERVVPEE